MSTLIIGAKGSMGLRYQAILRYLERDFKCVDIETPKDEIREIASRSSGVILATPTDTHVDFIQDLIPFRKPILCEKPVTKDVTQLRELMAKIRESGTPFSMMYQYEVLAPHVHKGVSRYNYFRHGNDGLVWDCLQIIGLARGDIILKEESPIWSCMINGRALNISHMDAAYIAFVQRWFRQPSESLQKITHIHEKTAEFKNGFY